MGFRENFQKLPFVRGKKGKNASAPSATNTSGGTTKPATAAHPQETNKALISYYVDILKKCIEENNLQGFYKDIPDGKTLEAQLESIATTAAPAVDELCTEWSLSHEMGSKAIKLALFDIMLFVDDSWSIISEEGGTRKEQLKKTIKWIAYAATLFDKDGISVRFFKHPCDSDPPVLPAYDYGYAKKLPTSLVDHIKREEKVFELISKVQFDGCTPLGTNLRSRVVDKIKESNGPKPTLVVILTDGVPTGEEEDEVRETVLYAKDYLRPGAVKFTFALIGNDKKAREYLGNLDGDRSLGDMVDCTSNIEYEQAEVQKLRKEDEENNRPQRPSLSEEGWLLKLLLGAVDRSLDKADEAAQPSTGPSFDKTDEVKHPSTGPSEQNTNNTPSNGSQQRRGLASTMRAGGHVQPSPQPQSFHQHPQPQNNQYSSNPATPQSTYYGHSSPQPSASPQQQTFHYSSPPQLNQYVPGAPQSHQYGPGTPQPTQYSSGLSTPQPYQNSSSPTPQSPYYGPNSPNLSPGPYSAFAPGFNQYPPAHPSGSNGPPPHRH